MVQLTPEGHERLVQELQTLKDQRPALTEEIRRAAADKDFRENAPLDAARERQGMVEGRIRQLEATLNTASILVTQDQSLDQAPLVRLGSRLALRDMATGQETSYQLVSPAESSPREGKLSIESPVGKALLGRELGDHVEIIVPRGTLTFLITGVQ